MSKHDCLPQVMDVLRSAHSESSVGGNVFEDANALRRISMTLHSWHEKECGDSNEYKSESIARGRRTKEPTGAIAPDGTRLDTWDERLRASGCVPVYGRGAKYKFEYDENGAPFREVHYHNENRARYYPIADRERGALKRLAKIMARYPTLRAYVQTDPRGAALYLLRPSDVPEGADVSAYYSRGIAIYK